MRVDTRGAVPDRCNSNSALISLESTEQQSVLTLSNDIFKFLDKILQEGLQDSSSSGTASLVSGVH